MISVEEAKARVLAGVVPLPAETVPLPAALGRVLAADVAARLTHPPADTSAMDGYAARSTDLGALPASLKIVGHVPAGQAHPGTVGPGEAVRLFTGSPVPAGADIVVLQENCDSGDGTVTVREAGAKGQHIRRAGQDFHAGDVGLTAGRRLAPRDVGLAAAMNVPWLAVRRRPRVALIATGDEIAMPGDTLAPNQIVSCNGIALAALVTQWGGEPTDLGIARDTPDSLAEKLRAAAGHDLLVTTGGASVGDYDLVAAALQRHGLALDFWKIAMRPGKPLMFGRFGESFGAMPVLGLPGNPVSALVCAQLFLKPLLAALQGLSTAEATLTARLETPLAANDRRQDYLRATLSRDERGGLLVRPFPVQDSAMISRFAWADGLVIRPPHAPAVGPGDAVPVIPLDGC